jgi:hypothetical protein
MAIFFKKTTLLFRQMVNFLKTHTWNSMFWVEGQLGQWIYYYFLIDGKKN